MHTYNNPVLEQLPLHLKRYIVEQQYDHYTAIDHAIWRYVMRQNYSYLKHVAYYPYIPGLKKAGLSIEHIPNLKTMNAHLQALGWGAVTVDGFIPPQAFMEFQAHRVLVIAAEIRQMEHIEYTPAPDIIHESSGHAPIIAEPEYAAYLQYFGHIGSKAMFSDADYKLYDAIRHLSIIKEQAGITAAEIREGEQRLETIQNNMGSPSEMALLSRLHWWTVEYGLIGTLEHPKIYGAGLLSSIGESASCMQANVKKLPYTIDALKYPYDITQPQPQLFVTPDFQNLIQVLETFSETMAFKRGGIESVRKAIACKNICTVVLSSGLEISGTFIPSNASTADYLQTTGATALAYGGKQLPGHGKATHALGFGSPIGKLSDTDKPLEDLTLSELMQYQEDGGRHLNLLFENQIEVHGLLSDLVEIEGKNMLLTFQDCTVKDKKTGKLLFYPEWGSFDMAVGKEIISVFSGASDKDAFTQISLENKAIRSQPSTSPQVEKLQHIYQQIRKLRQNNNPVNLKEAMALWETLHKNYGKDWLAPLELLEVLFHYQIGDELQHTIREYLKSKAKDSPKYRKLINDGLALIGRNEIDLINT